MAKARTRPSFDAAWKQFFSLRVAFEHLMTGFFPAIAALLDLGSAQPISAEWARGARRRLADAAWRVDYGDGSGRALDVVVEFQSRVDPKMAKRMMKLGRMVFEIRRAAGELGPGGLLRLLGVVIHSGARRWTAPGGHGPSVAADGEVMVVTPSAYASLDARRLAGEDPPEPNVVWTLFALCGVAGREYEDAKAAYRDIEATLRAAAVWLPRLGSAGKGLPRAYADFLSATAPALFAPAATRRFVAERLGVGYGKEKDDMSIAIQEAYDRGIKLAEKRGRKRGEERGQKRGEKRGVELGEKRGIKVGQIDLLRSMATSKFGADSAAELAAHLAETDDPARLADAGGWILECATGADLASRMGNGPPLNGARR